MKNCSELNSLINELDSFQIKNEEDAWGFFIEFVSKKFNCESATYFSVDEERKILTFTKVIGPNSQELTGVSFKYTGVAGWCAEHRKDLFVKNTGGHPLFSNKVDYITKFKTKSIICLVCFYGNKLSGVIEFINPLDKAEFEDIDFEMMKLLCNFMSKKIYIHNLEITIAHLNEKVHQTVNNLSGGFIGVDLDGKIIFFNPKAREILEIEQDYIGKPWTELEKISSDIFLALKEVLFENKISKRKEFIYSVAGKKKRIGYSTINIKAVDGSITGAGIIFQDITDIS